LESANKFPFGRGNTVREKKEVDGIVMDLIVARTPVLFMKSGRFLAFPEGRRIQAISGSMIQSRKSFEIDCVFPMRINISSFHAQCAWIEMTVTKTLVFRELFTPRKFSHSPPMGMTKNRRLFNDIS
jgi:hypothetical protein